MQDNAGNWLRFSDDWWTLYEQGTKALTAQPDGKARKEPSTKEIKEATCSKCKAVLPPRVRVCPACGHEKPINNQVDTVPGQLIELDDVRASKVKATKEDKQLWWSSLLYICLERGYKQGWAANKYRTKFGVWPRGLVDMQRIPSPEIRRWELSQRIRYAKASERRSA